MIDNGQVSYFSLPGISIM